MLPAGTKVKHIMGKFPYIAVIQKMYKNGNVDMRIIESEDKELDKIVKNEIYNIRFRKSKEYNFNNCYEVIK